jgi:hypothetical protein
MLGPVGCLRHWYVNREVAVRLMSWEAQPHTVKVPQTQLCSLEAVWLFPPDPLV